MIRCLAVADDGRRFFDTPRRHYAIRYAMQRQRLSAATLLMPRAAMLLFHAADITLTPFSPPRHAAADTIFSPAAATPLRLFLRHYAIIFRYATTPLRCRVYMRVCLIFTRCLHT